MEKQEKNIGVYFTSLRLENVRCFGEKAVLDLADSKNGWCRWNLILGNNGTGKSTLLQCLSAFQLTKGSLPHRNHREEVTDVVGFLSDNDLGAFFGKKIEHPYALEGYFIDSNTRMPANYSMLVSPKKSQLANAITNINSKIIVGHVREMTFSGNKRNYPLNFILGYGANRFMSNNKLSDKKPVASESLFNDDAKLVNAEEWLLGMDYAASRESEVKSFAAHRKKQIIEILTQILPGVADVRFTTPTKEALVPQVEFNTTFGWKGIHQLSLGYKTMVAWIVDVAARMFERYPDSETPLAEPLVILVDEIDLHLHPKWQRKIFDFLSEKFPKAQFIVTAHSPLVVQSAPKDANIIVLRQTEDENGNAYVKIDNDVESVRNWRLDQIMTSDLFGIESARNPEIEKNLERRTLLLQKDTLNTGEQEELEKLNQMADALPTADTPADIEAMEIIRKAAGILESKTGK